MVAPPFQRSSRIGCRLCERWSWPLAPPSRGIPRKPALFGTTERTEQSDQSWINCEFCATGGTLEAETSGARAFSFPLAKELAAGPVKLKVEVVPDKERGTGEGAQLEIGHAEIQ